MAAKRILALLGHPSDNSFNAALMERYVRAAEEAGAEVRLHRVGGMDFDPVLRHGYSQRQELEPDLVSFREDLSWSEHLALFTPLWWGSVPAGLKGLIDRTLLPGWAFRYEPDQSLPIALLAGRTARMVLTMDSPRWWYWLNYWGAAHGAMQRATLQFVGFETRTTTLTPAGRASDDQRSAWLDKLERLGRSDATTPLTSRQRRARRALAAA